MISDKNIDAVPEDDDRDYAFVLWLRIRHPVFAFEFITEQMNMQPTGGWSVGRPRQTPIGTPLSGVYSDTRWGYSLRIERRRDFFRCAFEFAETLEPQRLFLAKLRETGGLVALDLNLRGKFNIGDTLKVEQLAYLAALGIELGVEVFPNMR